MNIHINKLRHTLSHLFDNANAKIVKRQRKLKLQHFLYFLMNKISNNKSYDFSNTLLKKNNLCYVSRTSLIHYRTKIDYNLLTNFHDQLMHKLFNNKNRLLAIDGTKISIPYNFDDKSFKLTKNQRYRKGLINCIYDINNKIIVNMHLNNNYDERECVINQLNYINKNDTLIFDRGYYSKELLLKINNIGAHSIFRLRNNYKFTSNGLRPFRYAQFEQSLLVSLRSVRTSFACFATLSSLRSQLCI